MSRFKIVLLFVGFIVLIGSVLVLQFIWSFHTVTFSNPDKVTLNVRKVIDGVSQKQINHIVVDSLSIGFQNGDYCAEVDSTIYDTKPLCFTVNNKDVSLLVGLDYSKTKLSDLLLNEVDAVQSVITQKYSDVVGNFNIGSGVLYGRGDWYATTLTQKVAHKSEQGDVYRVLLQKSDEKWNIVAYPQIVLSKYGYPNVPINILNDVNKLIGARV